MIALIILVVAVFLLCLVIAKRPSDFRIERNLIIAAPAGSIQPLVDNFRQWIRWSPWEGLDPNLTREYLGPEAGKGAIYAWKGNNKAGAGRMTVLSSEPEHSIVLRLEFLRPFKATNTATFRFEPQSSGTLVTWSMEGNNGFVMKLFSLVFDSEKFVGKDFEKGLAALAKAVEPKT
ncbi:MAG: hypothetical protein RL173_2904 [Fibrobacterota bacterium]|jgi:hypothetical protein